MEDLRERELTLSSGPMRLVDEGPDCRGGRAVVLVHGSPVSSRTFEHQIRALAAFANRALA